MKIGISLSENAYTPESYAYEKYLKKLGHNVQLSYKLDPFNDINIYFMGMRSFFQKNEGIAKEVHEYQSLSTPPYAGIKNIAKRIVNKKPDGRIFLNNFVYKELGFKDHIPFIYRDMGVDEMFFQNPLVNPEFDIIYCGSVSTRIGLVQTLLNLAKKNYTILVIGNVTEIERHALKSKNITLMGAVKRELLPEMYRNAKFGLNYTPDIYPYNVQTSTKTLEYLASGLEVISNRYKWSEVFFEKINYSPVWLEEDGTLSIKEECCSKTVNSSIIKSYSWENILSSSNLDGFLKEVLDEVN